MTSSAGVSDSRHELRLALQPSFELALAPLELNHRIQGA